MTNTLLSGVSIMTTSHADSVLHEGSWPEKTIWGLIIAVDTRPA